MKYLNAVVAFLLVVALAMVLKNPTPPPQDPWFQNSVTGAARPVLVKFGAEWCGPCRHMDAILERAQPRLAGQVKVVRIDIDEKPELAQHYGIGSIPRLMLFQDGKILASHGGFGDESELQTWVGRYTR